MPRTGHVVGIITSALGPVQPPGYYVVVRLDEQTPWPAEWRKDLRVTVTPAEGA